jgi:Tfp pilus assembly protein PilO
VKQRTILAITGVGAVAVVAAWFLLLYQPKSKELAELRADVDAAKQKHATLASQLRQLEELKEDEPRIDADLARVKSYIPDTPDLGTFIREVNDVASQAAIDWVQVSPTEPVTGQGVATTALTLQVSGEFFDVVEFLGRLQEIPRAVTFDQMQLAPATDGSGSGTKLSVQLSGRMFSVADLNGQTATTGANTAGTSQRPPA